MTIDHDREWIIGCIKHDGFIHTHRFDKANQIILDALEPKDGDLISREDAIKALSEFYGYSIRMVDEITDLVNSIPSAEVTLQTPQTYGKSINPSNAEVVTDLISRADALEQMAQAECGVHYADCEADNCSCSYIKRILDIPSAEAVEAVYDTEWVAVRRNEYEDFLASAEAEPTVIRSRTLMPTKDFKEWAKRVREENPNVIVIPCDAEVVSAEASQNLAKPNKALKGSDLISRKDAISCCSCLHPEDCLEEIKKLPSAEAVQGWIPCSEKLPDEYIDVLATVHGHIEIGYFMEERGSFMFSFGDGYIIHGEEKERVLKEVTAWMPLPTPYKGGDDK